MSLNRIEEQLYHYLQRHPEERQFIQMKVREAVARAGEEAALALTEELWAYYRERSQVIPEFSAASLPAGAAKHSLRNLAEYLIRIWGPIKSKTKPPPLPSGN